MKSGGNTQGFTIVETLIYLAVSTAIMASVLTLVGGSQNKAQFQQAVNDTNQQINDVIDNVANGFYNKVGDFSCTAPSGAPIVNNAPADQGTNKDCMFIGRVIQFGVAGKPENMTVYDVVGIREIDGLQVTKLSDAAPRLIAPGVSTSTGFPDASDKRLLKGGFSASKMSYKDSSNIEQNVRGVAILSTFAQNSNGANFKPATQQLSFYAIKGTTLGNTSKEFVDSANDVNNYIKDIGGDGIQVCFDSGTTKQHANVFIGGSSQSERTTLEIKEGIC
jgi:hypothetical protein